MTPPRIHPTALVDASATIGDDVEIGPWVFVGPQCTIGNGAQLSARSTLEQNVRIGERVRIGVGAVLGGDPQDLKYRGEETWVEIGDDSVVREYATINRGTAHSVTTKVGRHCFLMSYVHLAHDCHLGDHIIISNGTQLAGHVTVEDRVTISGLCAVHQFVKIGQHSFISGGSLVGKDVPPYIKAGRTPLSYAGVNSIGMKRRGFSIERINHILDIYRVLYNKGMNTSQALEYIEEEIPATDERDEIVTFIRESGRGIIKRYTKGSNDDDLPI